MGAYTDHGWHAAGNICAWILQLSTFQNCVENISCVINPQTHRQIRFASRIVQEMVHVFRQIQTRSRTRLFDCPTTISGRSRYTWQQHHQTTSIAPRNVSETPSRLFHDHSLVLNKHARTIAWTVILKLGILWSCCWIQSCAAAEHANPDNGARVDAVKEVTIGSVEAVSLSGNKVENVAGLCWQSTSSLERCAELAARCMPVNTF